MVATRDPNLWLHTFIQIVIIFLVALPEYVLSVLIIQLVIIGLA